MCGTVCIFLAVFILTSISIEDGNGNAWTADPQVDDQVRFDHQTYVLESLLNIHRQVTLAPLDGSPRQFFICQFIAPINSQRTLTAGTPINAEKQPMPTSPINAIFGLTSGTYIISSPTLGFDYAIGRFVTNFSDLQKITTSTRDLAHPVIRSSSLCLGKVR